MNIALAQISPAFRSIAKNTSNHQYWIEQASKQNCKLICFPELSLTSYDPSYCIKNTFTINDKRFDVFQNLSNQKEISIAIGAPIKNNQGTTISMVLFSPKKKPFIYSKEFIHADEEKYFIPGKNANAFPIKDISPAICYESTIKSHYEKAHQMGSKIYLVSVAKSKNGIARNTKHLQKVAKKYSTKVLLTNYVGECGDFIAGGKSGIINEQGKLVAQLPHNNEGLLIWS